MAKKTTGKKPVKRPAKKRVKKTPKKTRREQEVEVRKKARKIQRGRNPRAREVDARATAQTVHKQTTSGYKAWARDPGKSDMEYVDTKGHGEDRRRRYKRQIAAATRKLAKRSK